MISHLCKILLKIFIIIISTLAYDTLTAQDSLWASIDDGLSIGEFISPSKSIVGDSKITIIKIDPQLYSLRLLCADEQNHSKLTVKEWCGKYKLICAVNAGMFQTDYKSNVGYMKNFDYNNNSKINSKYNSVAAFNPVDSYKDPYCIFDIDEKDMNAIILDYNTVVQNLRLIKWPARNRWSQQGKKWSEVALGQDKDGNVLFIFSRSPFSMHDFNKILINLPIGILCAQHLEGGPEASLYLKYKETEIELFGSYETGFNEFDDNNMYWAIPNVIGVIKKKN